MNTNRFENCDEMIRDLTLENTKYFTGAGDFLGCDDHGDSGIVSRDFLVTEARSLQSKMTLIWS